MFDMPGIFSAAFVCVLVLWVKGVAGQYSKLKKLVHPLEKSLTDVAVNDSHALLPRDLVKVKLVNNTVILMSKSHAGAYEKGMCRNISPEDAPALWNKEAWNNKTGAGDVIKMSWYTLTPFGAPYIRSLAASHWEICFRHIGRELQGVACALSPQYRPHKR